MITYATWGLVNMQTGMQEVWVELDAACVTEREAVSTRLVLRTAKLGRAKLWSAFCFRVIFPPPQTAELNGRLVPLHSVLHHLQDVVGVNKAIVVVGKAVSC